MLQTKRSLNYIFLSFNYSKFPIMIFHIINNLKGDEKLISASWYHVISNISILYPSIIK